MPASPGSPPAPPAPPARPPVAARWQLALGTALRASGAAVTVLCPVGVAGAGLRLWTAAVAARLAAPLLISCFLALACIEMQRRGGVRSWRAVPEPRRSAVWAVARFTVWPTVALNAARGAAHIKGRYFDEVFATGGGPGPPAADAARLFVGGLPWGGLARTLRRAHGVTRVLNMCEESAGPVGVYAREGIEQLRLYCIDYCDVPAEVIAQGVRWVREQLSCGRSVYIHCKAGKGRAATIAVAYLAQYEFGGDAERANRHVKQRRPVAIGTIHRRPDVIAYVRQHQ